MDGRTFVLDGVNFGTGTYLDRCECCGDPPVVALSASDMLDMPSLLERVIHIKGLGESYPVLSAICIRNDSMSPEMLSSAAGAASMLWDGPMILRSESPGCLEAALSAMNGRRCIVGTADPSNIEAMSELAARMSLPLIVGSPDVSELMDLARTAESAGVADILLDPEAVNMKGCLERCTDIRRLMVEHDLPQASHPVAVSAWSGEYAVAVSAVAMLRYASLLVLDDLDATSCSVLDALAGETVTVLN